MVIIRLEYSIKFKLGQMLHGQMLTLHISSRQWTIHADGLTIQPSKFGWVLTSNSGDMTSYLLLNYRDPKNNNKKMNFENPGGGSRFFKNVWIVNQARIFTFYQYIHHIITLTFILDFQFWFSKWDWFALLFKVPTNMINMKLSHLISSHLILK